MEKKIVFMGDADIVNIPIKEDDSPLVDFLVEFPELTFDEKVIEAKSYFGRRRIGEMLVYAQSLLPKGIKLLIKECHLPLNVQQSRWDERMKDLKKRFPKYTKEQLYERCSKTVAPVDVAPHSTGCAVDVTIINEQTGKPLTMGDKAATFTNAKYISRKARINRNRLVKAMKDAGFVNYPVEWWHWSYGDKYWAFVKKHKHAIYGPK